MITYFDLFFNSSLIVGFLALFFTGFRLVSSALRENNKPPINITYSSTSFDPKQSTTSLRQEEIEFIH